MAKEWYFVRKLRDHESTGSLDRFEIQVLDNAGRATSVGHINESSLELVIEGKNIPRPVIEAAKMRTEGKGEYVDPEGKSLPPF